MTAAGRTASRTFSAGFNQHGVSCGKQPFGEGNSFGLQEGFAAGEFHQRCEGRGMWRGRSSRRRMKLAAREFIDGAKDFVDTHLLAAMKSVCRVAPGAAQIASRQAHENAGEAGVGTFALNGAENFADHHLSMPYG